MEDPVAIPSSSTAPPAAVVPPPPLAPQQAPASAVVRAPTAAPEAAAASRRQLFSVELRPGETTIVSWKKLQKEAGQAAATSPQQPLPVVAAEPAVAAQLAPPGVAPTAENNPEDPAQPNRFNAVIEKIERLYMGKHSSDEEDLDDVPDDDQYDTDDSFIDDAELDEYFEVDNLKTKHSGFFVNKGTLEQIEPGTSSDVAPKKRRSKDPSGDHIENCQGATGPSGTGVPKRRSTDFATGVDAAKRAKISTYRDKDPSALLDLQQKKTVGGENQDPTNKIYHKEKHGTSNFSGTTVSGTAGPTQATHPITGRESAGTKPKGTRLERAIREFEKIVAQYKPPAIDTNEVDPNGQTSIKRRLPPEIKQKLAKVARLSTNHGKVQEHELMNRLMGIVGHLVQRRTLKRNMKDLVELGLSANQEKADRIQRVKMEINEMVKERVAKAKVNEQQDGSADDFQAVTDKRGAVEGKSAMDSALEDRMCDLYDLYVEGMDEDKGPQSRKLYVELAELWPQGCMDKFGIKDAISRSKERKRKLYNQQVQNDETLKRKRLAVAEKLPDSYPVVTQSAMALQISHPSIANPVTSYPVTDYGQNQASRSLERVRETSTGVVPDDSSKKVGEVKKKKRKPESYLVDTQANPMKVHSQHGSEKQKVPKHSDEANTITISTVLGLPFYDQQQS
ncbi:unnamed protein product [Alopecurus aequalis]